MTTIAGGGELAGQAQQEQQVQRAGRVGQHRLQPQGAGPLVADELLDAHARHPRQRRLEAGEHAGDQDEQDRPAEGQQAASGPSRRTCGRAAAG